MLATRLRGSLIPLRQSRMFEHRFGNRRLLFAWDDVKPVGLGVVTDLEIAPLAAINVLGARARQANSMCPAAPSTTLMMLGVGALGFQKPLTCGCRRHGVYPFTLGKMRIVFSLGRDSSRL